MERSRKRSDAIMMLGLEHERIEQVLEILAGQIDLMVSGDEFDAELVEMAVEYFLTFPDTCHHPKEDLLFKRLQTHGSDGGDVVGDLVSDHEELSRLTKEANQVLRSGLTAKVSKDTLDTLKTFLESYRRHLVSENASFFPKVLQTLSQDELDVIDFDIFDRPDPVFNQENEERFDHLRKEILLR